MLYIGILLHLDYLEICFQNSLLARIIIYQHGFPFIFFSQYKYYKIYWEYLPMALNIYFF